MNTSMLEQQKQKYLNNPDDLEALHLKLLSQLRVYPQQGQAHGEADLTDLSRSLLHQECNQYANKNSDIMHHRKAFIDHVVKILGDKQNYSTNNKERSFTEILGKEGLTLYQAALAEETNDINYRNAAFNKATRFIEGETLEQPASVIIGGVSACGKSFATDRVLNEIIGLPKKIDEHGKTINKGNLFTSLDGGDFREVSQMRKLAIRIANELGYRGIKDLHDHSKKPLEHIKEVITLVTLGEPKFGIIYPETYSNWIYSRSAHKNFMSTLNQGRTLIFTKVEGVQPDFQDVVKFMGEDRAWKNDNSEVFIDLNNKNNLKESKAYGESGFYFGKMGSDSAFDYYVSQFGEKALTIKIPNDLILLRKNPETNDWERAKSSDPGTIKISQTAYIAWEEANRPKDLEQFAKECPLQRPLELNGALQKLLASAEAMKTNAAEPQQEAAAIVSGNIAITNQYKKAIVKMQEQLEPTLSNTPDDDQGHSLRVSL